MIEVVLEERVLGPTVVGSTETVESVSNNLSKDRSPATISATPTSDTVSCTQSRLQVKLPKLTPPKFDGDIRKWTSFWDVYEEPFTMTESFPT